jgi:hypothetical protein
MRVMAVITSRVGVSRFLAAIGLPPEIPRFHPSRPPPQQELPFEENPTAATDPDFGGFDPDAPASIGFSR